MENQKVSIIIPCHNETHILEKTISNAINQKYKKKEIIVVGDNPSVEVRKILNKFSKKIKILINKEKLGLSGSLNYGIRESNGKIIVTLLADCVPSSEGWLLNLIAPFDDKNVVAASSVVEMPENIFESQEEIVKNLIPQEKNPYIPGLDEKGCAYRRDVLFEVGLFDSKHFKTAGEDFDMHFKMQRKGKIKLGVAKVKHIHPLSLKDLFNRTSSYSRGFGVLFRIYSFKIYKWQGAVARTLFPFWAIVKTIKLRPKSHKVKILLINLKLNFLWMKNFWKSFITKKQW